MLNLVMAGFWMAVGGLVLVWQWLHPEKRALTILGTDISVGWLAFVLALYNLAHWWRERSQVTDRQAPDKRRSARRLPEEREPIRPSGLPDPNFNFTDEPPSEQRVR